MKAKEKAKPKIKLSAVYDALRVAIGLLGVMMVVVGGLFGLWYIGEVLLSFNIWAGAIYLGLLLVAAVWYSPDLD